MSDYQLTPDPIRIIDLENEKEELLADIVEHKKIIARKTRLVKILEDVIQQLKNQH